MKRFFFLPIAIFVIFSMNSCAQPVGGQGFIPATILQGKVSNPEQLSLNEMDHATVYIDLNQDGLADMVPQWSGPLELNDQYTAILFEVIIGFQDGQPVTQLMDVLVNKGDLKNYKYTSGNNRLYNLEKSLAPVGGKNVVYVGDRVDPTYGTYQAYRLQQNFVMVRIR